MDLICLTYSNVDKIGYMSLMQSEMDQLETEVDEGGSEHRNIDTKLVKDKEFLIPFLIHTKQLFPKNG